MWKKHPKALPFLFFSEMWERFGYYLMIGIFTLYLKDVKAGYSMTVIIPKNIFLSGILSQKLAITPATFPPNDVERNQPPIIRAVSRGGASLETNDNPIGLKQISLTVNIP